VLTKLSPVPEAFLFGIYTEITRSSCSTADPAGKLPEETLDIVALKTSFGQKGFS
jgi:L-ascorbate peroxidase